LFIKISFKNSTKAADTLNVRFTIFDNDQLDNTLALFYNTFIIILYMFRALYVRHQDVELY